MHEAKITNIVKFSTIMSSLITKNSKMMGTRRKKNFRVCSMTSRAKSIYMIQPLATYR